MSDESFDKLTIIRAEYTNSSHTQALVLMRDKDNVDYPYFFCPNSGDEAPMYLYLNDLYNKGELKISINKAVDEELLSAEALMKRDTLLKESDHYMIDDYPISKGKKEEMKVYRQALRNIDKQKSFPDNIVWPKKPEVYE